MHGHLCGGNLSTLVIAIANWFPNFHFCCPMAACVNVCWDGNQHDLPHIVINSEEQIAKICALHVSSCTDLRRFAFLLTWEAGELAKNDLSRSVESWLLRRPTWRQRWSLNHAIVGIKALCRSRSKQAVFPRHRWHRWHRWILHTVAFRMHAALGYPGAAQPPYIKTVKSQESKV